MPILTISGSEFETEENKLNLLQEEKPLVCVFDPIAAHAPILDFALASLRDRINIFWQSLFSRLWIEIGGITEKMHRGLIAIKRPVLLISELEVVPPGYSYGIEMLKNFRQTDRLKDTPLIVISSPDCLSKAFEEASKELKELRVSQFFNWKDLEKLPEEQKRLFDFVSQILASRNKSQK
jgi:hypothetical protein